MINLSKKSSNLLIVLTTILAMVITFSCSSDDPEQPASPIVSCQIGGACIANVYTLEQCMAMTAGTIVPSCGGSSSSRLGSSLVSSSSNEVKVPCEIAGICIADVYTVQVCLQIGSIVGPCSSVSSSSSSSSDNNGGDAKVSCEIAGFCIADAYTAQVCLQVGTVVESCPVASSSSSSEEVASSSSAIRSSSSAGSAGELMNCLISKGSNSYCYDISDAAECIEYGGVPSTCEKIAGCGNFCKWENGCFEIVPDPAAVYGKNAISTCSAAQSNCSSYGLGGPYSNSNCTNNPSSSSLAPSSSSSVAPSSSSQPQSNSFTDSRDKRVYKTVKIDNQVWMAENLNYNASGSVCYGNLDSNCVKYGRLYNWATTMVLAASCNNSGGCSSQIQTKHKGICPEGWHIPNTSDWDILMNYVQTDNGYTYTSGGHASVAGKYLKATSFNGEDKYGFAALLGGSRADSDFYSVGIEGYFWSTKENNSLAYYRRMLNNFEESYWEQNGKYHSRSVRCLKD